MIRVHLWEWQKKRKTEGQSDITVKMVFTFYKADIDLIPDTLDSPPSLPKVTLSNSGYDPKTKNKQKVKKN